MQICEKMTFYNPNIDLGIDNVYTIFDPNLSIRSQGMEHNQLLTSVKGHNYVANLQKMTLYNHTVDLVNDNVNTKFGLIPLIRSQDIERKPN